MFRFWDTFTEKLQFEFLVKKPGNLRLRKKIYLQSFRSEIRTNFTWYIMDFGEIGHQLGVVKFCEWTGRTS